MMFTGKVALVTGATSGIGRATAEQVAAAGAHVLAVGRSGERLTAIADALGSRGDAIPCDVARPEQIETLMGTVKAGSGRIDVLVIAAGVSDAPDVPDLTVDDYARLMDVNGRGAAFTFVHALPLLARGASVVFVGSVAGRKGQPGDPLYAASKGFVRAFARSAGTDRALLERGIRVNTVSPGPIDTPLTHAAVADEAARTAVEAMVPMARWGRADEVAAAILFLASEASGFTTGAEITVDGGMAHA